MVRFSERTTQTTADKENESKNLTVCSACKCFNNIENYKNKRGGGERKRGKKNKEEGFIIAN